MSCCGGNNHGNDHAHHNNDGSDNVKSGSRMAIIVAVLALAGMALYLVR